MATTTQRAAVGLGLGAVAGVLDVIPMVVQGLSWDANLPMPSAVQGILTAFLCLVPAAILIGWKEPFALVPIGAMTTALGATLGFAVRRLLDGAKSSSARE